MKLSKIVLVFTRFMNQNKTFTDMVTQIVKIFPSFKGVKDVITSSDAEIITNAGKVVLQDSIKMSAVKEEIEKRYSDKPVDNEPIVVEFTEQ